jgi:DNA topoisomerase-1
MIDDFYLPFKKDVEKTIETAERAKGERELGVDPATGKKVVARIGRYGPMVQIGEADEEEKPRFAKVPTGQSIETITFDEAMNLFKLQGVLGQYEEKDISIGIGRFGPYVKWGDEFISIPRGEDMNAVGLNRAIQLIEHKIKADAPIAFYNDKPVTKGKGRFGPYIKWDGMFINVPKKYNFDSLSQADINELVEAKIKKEADPYIQRWPDEKISLENARWGPVVKFGKKIIKLPKKADDTKYTEEDLKDISLEDAKKMIETEMPGAFTKKSKQTTKKVAKKTATKTTKKKKKS